MAELITPVTGERFDPALLGQAVEMVLAEFPNDISERLIALHGSIPEIVKVAVNRGTRVYERLRKEGRDVPQSRYPLLAAAVFSVQGRKAGVQASNGNVAKEYDRLVAHGDVPLDVVAQCRLVDEGLVGLLIKASRVLASVRDEETAVPPLMIGMVVPAVLATAGLDVEDPVAVVRAVLARGVELAARQRGRAEGDDLVHHSTFPVMGNIDLVYQLAGYRTAIAELLAPGSDGDVDDVVNRHARACAEALRKGMTHDWGFAPEALAGLRRLVRMFASAAPDGGKGAERVFVELHPDAAKETRPNAKELLVEENETSGTADAADSGLLLAEDVVEVVLEGLFAGTNRRQRVVLSNWLGGVRSSRSQDDLVFLVDRVRRVDQLVRSGSAVTPSFVRTAETEAAFGVVRSRVRDAIVLGLSGLTLAQAVLPPLWTDRAHAVRLVAGRVRVELGRGLSTPAKAALVSAVVVRGPAQVVQRRAEPDRPRVCPCGGGRRGRDRTEVRDEVACPHRPWHERGRVENYTTLTEFCETTSVDATRLLLTRYDGFWREWVEDVMTREVS
jgi:hypothetical protein